MASLSDTPLRRDGLVVRELGGQCIVFAPDTRHLHQLNPSATLVWRLLAPNVSLNQIAREIAEETGTDLREVENDVLALVSRLDELGLLGAWSAVDAGSVSS